MSDEGGFLREDDDGGCDGCGTAGSFSAAWHEAFCVVLCSTCRSAERLISKSTAKSAYLLTDTDLSKLGSISKPNPQNSRWKPMKLYLERQCEEAAIKKHGSMEELEELIEKRRDQKMDEILKKRSRADQAEEEGGQEEEEDASLVSAAQQKMRDKLRGDYSRDINGLSEQPRLGAEFVEEI